MILYINTCGTKIDIKLFKKGKIIKEEIINGQKSTSQFIMPTIKKVVGDNEVSEIVVVNGPGSFTGARLGVTIAKTFAYVKNIPLKTISTLEEKAISSKSSKKIISVEEVNGFFVGVFNKSNKLIGDYKYLNKVEYEEFSKKYKIINEVKYDYEKIIEFSSKKEAINPHAAKALYVKLIDPEKN